jgi:secondary thiamine-phosphate synthase enzyme
MPGSLARLLLEWFGHFSGDANGVNSYQPSGQRPGTVQKKTAMLHQARHEIRIETRGRGFYEFTDTVQTWLSHHRFQTGLLTLLVRHTSASLLIQENADPDVRRDLEAFFSRLVPDGETLFVHTAEGEDDMPAHVRAALTAVTVSVPVAQGRLALGTWQGIYLWEHRHAPHQRSIAVHFIGD